MTKERIKPKTKESVIKHAMSKEVLDKVWIAILEGIGKEQESFTIEQLMGEKLIATKQPKK